MGIPGLTTFINMNPKLLQPHKLRDTRVVMDGNNLFYCLYYDYHINYRYCGNYDQYARNLEHYFGTLSSCNITPIIVFDGGYEIDDRKLRTTLSRAQERIHLGGFISHGGSGRVLPVLAEATFKHTLDKLGIVHMTCDFEADDQLAALANLYDCPVVSNDSDFFVYNIHRGFIPLDGLTAEISKDSDGSNYIETKIYNIQSFVKFFRCPSVDFVALFATLLGNDFVDGRKFSNVFANIKLPRTKSKRYVVPKKQSKMAGLLSWLEDLDSVDLAIEEITHFVKKEDREKIKKIILRSIDSYTNIKPELVPIIDGSIESHEGQESTVKTYLGSVIPPWFLREFHHGSLSVKLFNALVLHRVVLLSQVEDMSVESAHQCAAKIRSTAYGILLLEETHSRSERDKIPEVLTRDFCVEEYGRVGKKLTKTFVQPVIELPSGKALPSLSDMPAMSSQERLTILFDSFSITQKQFEDIPNDLHLVFAATIFWLRHAQPRMTKDHLRAIIICVLKLYCLDPSSEDVCEVLQGCTLEEVKTAKQKLEKTVHLPQYDNICGSIVHSFAQWHACVLAAIHLNQLLLKPVPEPNPAKVYNGNVAYAMCRELATRRDPDLYVVETLGRRTGIAKVYNEWMQVCLNSVTGDSFHVVNIAKKGTKRAGKKKGQVPSRQQVVDIDKIDSEDKITHSRTKQSSNALLVSCDIENKFGMLTLSSDEEKAEAAL